MESGTSAPALGTAFCHEAFFYASPDEFLAGTIPFLLEGVTTGEPALVVVSADKIRLMQEALHDDAGAVMFADMADVGQNPARIIPAWRRFIDDHAPDGSPARGIGEPIWAARTAAELVECQLHESLLNVAFGSSPGWVLRCPYDRAALPPDVIAEAHHSHPFVVDAGGRRTSVEYRDDRAVDAPFQVPLPEPLGDAITFPFVEETLHDVRELTSRLAIAAGLTRRQAADLTLATNELATNSVMHGGGHGVLRLWQAGDTIVSEVRDGGRIEQPLAGRVFPDAERPTGRGLWLANQLCELMQIRSSAVGTVIRLHMRRG